MSGPSRPRISVCIANYNGELMLRDCIDSLLVQDVDADIEIIVHDDASTDGSLALLEKSYTQAKVLASKENVGFCISNNRMADEATGDYLLLLNNDAALAPDALSVLLAEQARINAPCILSLPQHDWDTGKLVDRGCLLDPFYNPVPNLDASRQDVAYVIGACLWCPRKLWHDLGGLPEWMGSIGEDMYLCCAARLRGLQVRGLSGSAFRHRLGASFGGARIRGDRLRTTLRRRQLSERNKTYVMFVCTPGLMVWPLLVAHISLLLLEGVIQSIVARDLAIFSKIYWGVPTSIFRQWAHLRALRATIQTTRGGPARDYWRGFTLAPRKVLMLLRFGFPSISS